MGIDIVHTQSGYVGQRVSQTGSRYIIGSSGFELIRKLVECGALETDILNHLTATHIRRQAVEPFFLAIKHTDTRRTVDLMSAECKEIAIQILHVYRKVRGTLGTVYQHGDSVVMSRTNHLFHGIYCTEHIAHVGDAHQTGALVKQLFVFVQTELAFVGNGNHAQTDAFASLNQLPAHNVGVMFHLAYDHFIAFLQNGIAKGRSHQINTFCGAAGKDYLSSGASIQKAAHSFTGLLMQFSSLL